MIRSYKKFLKRYPHLKDGFEWEHLTFIKGDDALWLIGLWVFIGWIIAKTVDLVTAVIGIVLNVYWLTWYVSAFMFNFVFALYLWKGIQIIKSKKGGKK
jgi:hypothetical protein